MPTTDTKPTSLIINKLTRTQYDTAVKDPNQLYACTDTNQLFLGTAEISGGMALQSGQSGKFLSTDGTNTTWETIDLSSYATKDSPVLTGTPTAPTASAGTNTTQIATTAFVQAKIQLVSELPASPVAGVLYGIAEDE